MEPTTQFSPIDTESAATEQQLRFPPLPKIAGFRSTRRREVPRKGSRDFETKLKLKLKRGASKKSGASKGFRATKRS
ncbi:unnamed protein product [Linum trigynum]|uniref:Uncharacterized protein n=1 Tax=Linum trigynum TaxID=586398 RepID=A0AAV2DUP6_9ROSI